MKYNDSWHTKKTQKQWKNSKITLNCIMIVSLHYNLVNGFDEIYKSLQSRLWLFLNFFGKTTLKIKSNIFAKNLGKPWKQSTFRISLHFRKQFSNIENFYSPSIRRQNLWLIHWKDRVTIKIIEANK